jgi:hypothetical protein
VPSRTPRSYFLTPAELEAKVLEDPGIKRTGVKVGARVVHGSVERDSSGKRVRFDMTDGKATYKVDYRGIIPDTFSDSVDVVVEGRLGDDGVFHATHAAREVRVALRGRAGELLAGHARGVQERCPAAPIPPTPRPPRRRRRSKP